MKTYREFRKPNCKHKQLVSIGEYDLCFNCDVIYRNGEIQKYD